MSHGDAHDEQADTADSTDLDVATHRAGRVVEAAAEQVREALLACASKDWLTKQLTALGREVELAKASLEAATVAQHREWRDVALAEQEAGTNLLGMLTGSADRKVASERAEAEQASVDLARAQQRVIGVSSELAAVRARLDSLGDVELRLELAVQVYADRLRLVGDSTAQVWHVTRDALRAAARRRVEIIEAIAAGRRARAGLSEVLAFLEPLLRYTAFHAWLFDDSALWTGESQRRLDALSGDLSSVQLLLARFRAEFGDIFPLEAAQMIELSDLTFVSVRPDSNRHELFNQVTSVRHSTTAARERVEGWLRDLATELAHLRPHEEELLRYHRKALEEVIASAHRTTSDPA